MPLSSEPVMVKPLMFTSLAVMSKTSSLMFLASTVTSEEPAPIRFTGLFTSTVSAYIPGQTKILELAGEASIAC